MSPEPLLRLLDNPIGIAHARRRLRCRQALPGFCFVALGALCVVIWAGAAGSDAHAWAAASDLLLVAMGALLCLCGTAQVSASVAADRRSGLLDFHRTTATSAWTDALGYVAGCAAREHVSVLLLTPFFVLASIQAGGSFVQAAIALYLVLAAGLLCHVFGAFVGLALRSGRAAAIAIASLLGLSMLASGAASVGLTAFAHLTPLPALQSLGYLGLLPSSVPEFTLFGIPCTPVTFTPLFQGYLSVFVAWAAARRLRAASAPACTRRGALLFFALTMLFTVAPMWDGLVDADALSVAVGIWLMSSGLLAGTLALVLVPSFAGHLRSVRRARRTGRPQPWHAEGATSWPLVPCFVFLSAAGLALILARGRASGALAPGPLASREVLVALAGCGLFVGLVFGALECIRLAPSDGSRKGLLALGCMSVALPWVLGMGAAMLFSDPALPDFLHATSPLSALLGSVDGLVRQLAGRPPAQGDPARFWSLIVTGVATCALWRAAGRTRAEIAAHEAAARDLPSIDAYRDAC